MGYWLKFPQSVIPHFILLWNNYFYGKALIFFWQQHKWCFISISPWVSMSFLTQCSLPVPPRDNTDIFFLHSRSSWVVLRKHTYYASVQWLPCECYFNTEPSVETSLRLQGIVSISNFIYFCQFIHFKVFIRRKAIEMTHAE